MRKRSLLPDLMAAFGSRIAADYVTETCYHLRKTMLRMATIYYVE